MMMGWLFLKMELIIDFQCFIILLCSVNMK